MFSWSQALTRFKFQRFSRTLLIMNMPHQLSHRLHIRAIEDLASRLRETVIIRLSQFVIANTTAQKENSCRKTLLPVNHEV